MSLIWIKGCLYGLLILSSNEPSMLAKCVQTQRYSQHTIDASQATAKDAVAFSNACRAAFILAGPKEPNHRTVALVCSGAKVEFKKN